VRIHRELSSQAVQHFPDEYFDWVYIDGDHSYEFAKADLEAYLPKVKKSGYITGDDYHWGPAEGFPVMTAVNEIVNRDDAEMISVHAGQFILKKT
jgi:hypothetical protein